MVGKRKVGTRVAVIAAAGFMATCNGGGGSEKLGQSAAKSTTINLQLEERTNECNPNEVQDVFRVTNNDTVPVKLSDITIQYWVNETTANAILARVANNGCVSLPNHCGHDHSHDFDLDDWKGDGWDDDDGEHQDACDFWIGPTRVNVAAAPQSCAGEEANWVVTISSKDRWTTIQPGQAWTNIAVNLSLPHHRNFTPGSASWYSSCLGATFTSPSHSALYYQGSLVRASTGIPPACMAPTGSQVVGGATAPAIANGLVPLVGHLPGTTPIILGISLPIQDPNNQIPGLLSALYDPTSSQYGQYLTPAQFGAQFGASSTDYNTVVNFLQTAGLTIVKTYANNTHITVSGTAQQIENVFNVTLNQYQRRDGTIFYAPANDPSINLNVPIAFISGLDSFPVFIGNNGQGPSYSSCPSNSSEGGKGYIGDDFKNIYLGPGNVPQTGITGPSSHPANHRMTAAVVAFDGLNMTDVTNYQNLVNTTFSRSKTAHVTQIPCNGTSPITPASAENEVALTVEMLYAMAPDAQINVYEYPATTGTYIGSSAAFDTIMNRIVDDPTVNVIVNPWTWRSGSGSPDTGTANVLLQAALEGMAFFQASGDTGPYLNRTASNGWCSAAAANSCASNHDCNACVTGHCTFDNSVCATDANCTANPCILPGVPEPMILSPLMTVVGGTLLPQSTTGYEGQWNPSDPANPNPTSVANCTAGGNGVCASASCNGHSVCDTGELAWTNQVVGGPAPGSCSGFTSVALAPPKATSGGYAVGYTSDLGMSYPALPMPSWQSVIAAQFDPANAGAGAVRTVPDVSFLADQVTYYESTSGSSVQKACPGGTSAAAALWAGLALLLDQKAVDLGQPTIGFANPSLYQKAAGNSTAATSTSYYANFTDVGATFPSGGTPGVTTPTALTTCSTNANTFQTVTQPGYDLVSGLGSPNSGIIGASTILPKQSCQPGSNLTLLVSAGAVVAYAPNGSWGETGAPGVRKIPLEATGSLGGASSLTGAIASDVINTCAADSSGGGNVVCTANNQNVYIINDTAGTVNPLVNSAANGTEFFSGGDCTNCNVAVDPLTHLAYISMGTTSGPALEVLDINSATFKATIPLNIPMDSEGDQGTSEAIQVDTTRGAVLSPNESGNYQYIAYQPSVGISAVYDFNMNGMPGVPWAYFDSAAEDCSTGIAIAPVEFEPGFTNGNQVVLVDLTMARFHQNASGNGNWAPGRCTGAGGGGIGCAVDADCVVGPTNYGPCDPFYGAGFTTMNEFNSFAGVIGGGAVDSSGSHLGIVATEFGGPGFAVIKMPATAGNTHPALQQYVAVSMPNTPATPSPGTPWQMGWDPHTIGIYKSPITLRTYGVFQNDPNQNGTRDFIAVVDLQALLDKALQKGGGVTPVTQLAASDLTFCCSQDHTANGCPNWTSSLTPAQCMVRFVNN